MNKIVIFCLLIIVSLVSLIACDSIQSSDGSNNAEIVGIKLNIYDENDSIVFELSSNLNVDEQNIVLEESKTYIVEIEYMQSGGSVYVGLLSEGIVFEYNEEFLLVEKCSDDEIDTKYYLKMLKASETYTLNVKVDEYMLELNFCFE